MNFKRFAFLAIALFILIFLIPSFAVAGPLLTIKDVSDYPDPFSPNGDSIEDTTTISATISASGFIHHSLQAGRQMRKKSPRSSLRLIYKLTIRNSQGRVVKRFVRRKKIKDNSEIKISRRWDGKNFRRRNVPDGRYTYEIKARVRRVKAEAKGGDVTIKTVSGLGVSVSPDFWDIGPAEVDTIITMKEVDKITVLNDGGVNATYSLSLINPQGWASSQTETGVEAYILNGAFDSDGLLTWNEASHALSAVPARSTSTKFAGDETGVNVEPGQGRTLWLQFKSPRITSITTEQDIEVIINAEVP